MKKWFTEENLIKMMMVFLIIQPLLDFYLLFEPTVANFFHFSPATILRILFLGLIMVVALFTIRLKKRHWWYVLYLALVGAYTLIHHQNALHFTSYAGDFGYSFFSEAFYIIRMLMPLAMFFIATHLSFSDKKLEKVITWLVILISGSIVLSNLLVISLASYTKTTISAGMPFWFIDHYQRYNYLQLASRGFFTSANRIAALEVLLTPVLFYVTIRKPSQKNIILVVIQMLAMFMLGTKVATFGFVILLILTLLVYLFFCFIKKELTWHTKTWITFILLGLACVVIVPFSPAVNRTKTEQQSHLNHSKDPVCVKIEENTDKQLLYIDPTVAFKPKDDETCPTAEQIEKQKLALVERNMAQLNEDEKKQYLISFIGLEYQNFAIKESFVIESYPYQNDPYFWYQIMKKPVGDRTNYRLLEMSMLDRIKEINNNPKDELLGITFTRMSNIFDLERDFISHYYTLGWIGFVLLLVPYLIIPILCAAKMLLQFKKKFTFYHVMLMMSLGITLFAAFYSGNVMDGLIVTLILGFIMGLLFKSVFEKEEIVSSDKKISVLMPSYNDADSIEETLDTVLAQEYTNWELIIIDDGSKDNTKKVIAEYCKQKDKNHQITYLYQENSDQLRALLHGMEKITGDYVYILHSDDLLASPTVFKKAVAYLDTHPDVDGIMGDLIVIDKDSKITGEQKVLPYQNKPWIPPLQLLWLGRNLYVDFAFHRRTSFEKNVKENYLIWNTPFWLSTAPKVSVLNIVKVDFEFIKYRVYDGNYIHNEVGKLNVINGELRTATSLMAFYHLPFYRIQYVFYRICSNLHIESLFAPIYKKKPTEHKAEILSFMFQKRFPEGIDKYPFLSSLLAFYQHEAKRKIYFDDIYQGEEIYEGNQMRKFNKQMIENCLPTLYYQMFKEMGKGFDEIVVTKENKEKAEKLIRFLCLYPYVKITIKKEGKK